MQDKPNSPKYPWMPMTSWLGVSLAQGFVTRLLNQELCDEVTVVESITEGFSPSEVYFKPRGYYELTDDDITHSIYESLRFLRSIV